MYQKEWQNWILVGDVKKIGQTNSEQLAHSLNEMSQKLSASMTDLKCANEKLQADIERERALEQAQLDFFSAVSHELKTPITVIKGQTEGMILNVGDYQNRNKYLVRSLEIINTMEIWYRKFSRFPV